MNIKLDALTRNINLPERHRAVNYVEEDEQDDIQSCQYV